MKEQRSSLEKCIVMLLFFTGVLSVVLNMSMLATSLVASSKPRHERSIEEVHLRTRRMDEMLAKLNAFSALEGEKERSPKKVEQQNDIADFSLGKGNIRRDGADGMEPKNRVGA